MPLIMSLEGPRVDRLAQLRGELYAIAPRKWWQLSSQLGGFFTPWAFNWPFALGMFGLGLWLGGSARGRRIVAAMRGR